jgi:hypothetical protein
MLRRREGVPTAVPVWLAEKRWAIPAVLAVGTAAVLACAPHWRPLNPGVDPPPGTVSLHPDSGGSVFVATRSGRTGCQITATQVGCHVRFAVPTPLIDGMPANGVVVKSDGAWSWVIGDMGDAHFVTLSYETTYRALGWTVDPASDGTRFTNDGSGHGMFVSAEGVEAF